MGRDAKRAARLLGLVLAAGALLIPWVADAASKSGAKAAKAPAGWVFTSTNNPKGNQVIVFKRGTDGKLKQSAKVSTGGKGIASEPPFGFPIVDSSGSINLTPDGKLLFVVNAGSNSITSFKVTDSGLKKVQVVGSNGKLPISLASSAGHLLYVVNEASKNISGWRFAPDGKLTSIKGSKEKLTAVKPKGGKDNVGVAAGIGFVNNGGVVVVTQRGLPRTYGEINTFLIDHNGAAGPAKAYATRGVANPFGFSAVGSYLLVSNAGFVATPSGAMPNPADFSQFTGTAATYKVSLDGKVRFVKNTLTNGRAACWLIVTKNGRTAFVTNTLSSGTPPAGGPLSGQGAVSSMSVGGNGQLKVQRQANASPGFPGDEALSRDDKYLYVSVPSIIAPGGSHMDVYKLKSDGSMKRIQTLPSPTASPYPNNLSGIGAF